MPRPHDIADIVRDEAERQVRWRLWSCLNGCVIQVFIAAILLVIVGFIVVQMFFGVDVVHRIRVIVRPEVEIVEEIDEHEIDERGHEGGGIWSGHAPFTCGGNASMELRGARASLPGQIAIIAEGNCALTLVDVEVSAETAVLARGNARVNVHGDSTLQGDRFAVEAQGNSEVNAYGATVLGGVDVKGNASFNQ